MIYLRWANWINEKLPSTCLADVKKRNEMEKRKISSAHSHTVAVKASDILIHPQWDGFSTFFGRRWNFRVWHKSGNESRTKKSFDLRFCQKLTQRENFLDLRCLKLKFWVELGREKIDFSWKTSANREQTFSEFISPFDLLSFPLVVLAFYGFILTR